MTQCCGQVMVLVLVLLPGVCTDCSIRVYRSFVEVLGSYTYVHFIRWLHYCEVLPNASVSTSVLTCYSTSATHDMSSRKYWNTYVLDPCHKWIEFSLRGNASPVIF